MVGEPKPQTNKMKQTIIPIILGIALISLASAIYAGECLEVDLSELESLDNVVYDVVGNSSNLEGLTIELNGTIANICVAINYRPDSFTIIFIDNSTKETIIEVEVPGDCPSCSSGGGTRTIYKDRDIIVEVDNYIDREVIINNTTIGIEDTAEPTTEEEPERKPYWKLWVFGIVLILVMYILFKLSRRKSYSFEHASHEEEEHKNEKEVYK